MPMRVAMKSGGAILTILLAVWSASHETLAQQPAAQTSANAVAVTPIDPGGVSLPAADKSASERQFSFIVYGDTRGPADGQTLQPQHGDVIDTMVRVIHERHQTPFPVRFVVQTGDAVSSGRYGSQWNVSYVPLIDRLIQHGGVPYLFAVGNHDVGSSPDLNDEGRRLGLANTAAAMAKLWPPEASPSRLAGYPTFTFAYGQFFFVVLDSNIPNDRVQHDWVEAQLHTVDRTRYPFIVAAFHHPPITSGPHGGDTVEPQSEAMRRVYMPLFRQHHVRLLLAGHDHLYDHYIERYDDAEGTHRMDHLITGGGGAPIYRYNGEPDLARYAKTALPQAVRIEHAVRPGANESDNPHHFVVVEVSGSRLTVRLVATVTAPFLPYGTDSASLE